MLKIETILPICCYISPCIGLNMAPHRRRLEPVSPCPSPLCWKSPYATPHPISIAWVNTTNPLHEDFQRTSLAALSRNEYIEALWYIAEGASTSGDLGCHAQDTSLLVRWLDPPLCPQIRAPRSQVRVVFSPVRGPG